MRLRGIVGNVYKLVFEVYFCLIWGSLLFYRLFFKIRSSGLYVNEYFLFVILVGW